MPRKIIWMLNNKLQDRRGQNKIKDRNGNLHNQPWKLPCYPLLTGELCNSTIRIVAKIIFLFSDRGKQHALSQQKPSKALLKRGFQ